MRPVFWMVLTAGVVAVWTGMAAAGGDEAGTTTLRGILAVPGTNAPPGVVAVLQGLHQERKPCALKAATLELAAAIREFAATGATVLVTGIPGEAAFTVTSICIDGRTRQPTASSDAPTNTSILSHLHWVGVPASER